MLPPSQIVMWCAGASAEPYFVVPTACEADACLDHRCDWAKNAMLDAEMLVAVAHAAVLAGRHDPKSWFGPEELLGNWVLSCSTVEPQLPFVFRCCLGGAYTMLNMDIGRARGRSEQQ